MVDAQPVDVGWLALDVVEAPVGLRARDATGGAVAGAVILSEVRQHGFPKRAVKGQLGGDTVVRGEF